MTEQLEVVVNVIINTLTSSLISVYLTLI